MNKGSRSIPANITYSKVTQSVCYATRLNRFTNFSEIWHRNTSILEEGHANLNRVNQYGEAEPQAIVSTYII